MDLLNIGYCNTCNKQFKGKVGLVIHRRRMHAVAYHQEATDIIIANHANQTRPRWTDGDSRRMAQIEIDIFSQKADSRRFPINNAIAEQFPERSVTAIKTHRASTKYKELVRTLQASDDIQLHTATITDTATNTDNDSTTNTDTNTDTNSNIITDTFTNTGINCYSNTEPYTDNDIDLNTSRQRIHIDTNINSHCTNINTNLQYTNRNIHHTHNINSNTNTIQNHPSVNRRNTLDEINNNSMNRLVESIQKKNHSLNNTTKIIKLNILQYILDNIPTIPILPDLLFHIQNFKSNNIQHLIDLDHRYLLQSTNIINNKVITILNSNSINNNRLNPNNIGILSNKAFKRRHRRILYAKTQNMFTKNRSALSRAIFDNDDITVECDEVPIENQFIFWSELFNKTSIPFNRTFTNNTLDNTTPISLGEVQACFNALHDGAPGIDNIKKK